MITVSKVAEKQVSYPLAFSYKKLGIRGKLVILFLSETKGVVLEAENSAGRYSGEFCESLHTCMDNSIWQPVNVSIKH